MNTRIRYEGELYDLADLDIRYDTITFYATKENDEAESNFGTCDLTGWKGNVVPCIALSTSTGEVVEFEVLDVFVHGRLGKLAGAF